MFRTYGSLGDSLYPHVKEDVRRVVSQCTSAKDPASRIGLELEGFGLTADGALVSLDNLFVDPPAGVEHEISRAAWEVGTPPDLFQPGVFRSQRKHLEQLVGSIRSWARRNGVTLLIGSAGMDTDGFIPRPWRADGPGALWPITPKERYLRMARNADARRVAGETSHRVRFGLFPERELLPVYGGLAGSVQTNTSWPVAQFAQKRRASILATPLSIAINTASPLVDGLPVGVKNGRRLFFGGAYYGHDQNGWPLHYYVGPGGFLDGIEGGDHVIEAVLAQLVPDRVLISDPPADLSPSELAMWAHKGAYCCNRVRHQEQAGPAPAHVRVEAREMCGQPTIVDNMAAAWYRVGLTELFAELFPTAPITYDQVEANVKEATQHGLHGDLFFPYPDGSPSRWSATVEVVSAWLEAVRSWYVRKGYTLDEIDPLYGALRVRLDRLQTGADLLMRWYEQAPNTRVLYSVFAAWGETDRPVGGWPTDWSEAKALLR